MVKLVVKSGRFNIGDSFFVENEIFSMSENEFQRPHIQSLVREGVLCVLSEEKNVEDSEEELVEEEKVEEKPSEVNEEELRAKFKGWYKKEQVAKLKELGVEKIPKYEDDRVDLLIKLMR